MMVKCVKCNLMFVTVIINNGVKLYFALNCIYLRLIDGFNETETETENCA